MSSRVRVKTRDVVAGAVHLHADAVELPLDRGRADPVERGVEVLGRLREHRLERPAELEPEGGEPVAPPSSAAAATAPRSPRSISARRTGRGGTPAAWRPPRASRPRARPGAARPRAGRARSRCSPRSRARSSRASSRAAAASEPGPGAADCRRAVVHVEDGSVARGAGAGSVAQRGPADADRRVPQLARTGRPPRPAPPGAQTGQARRRSPRSSRAATRSRRRQPTCARLPRAAFRDSR